MFVTELKPHPSIVPDLVDVQPPGFAAVFDGHRRCEPAELAAQRLPDLLSRHVKLWH